MIRRVVVLAVCACTLCSFLAVRSSDAQASLPKIPTRPLGAIVSKSTDSLGAQVVVRALSSGAVLVNDVMRRRVLMFEPSLSSYKVVIDSVSTAATGMASAIASSQLIRYDGDSSLYVDIATQSLLVIDGSGKVARVMALPRPTDAMYLASSAFGRAFVDPKGMLIYRGMRPPKITPPEPGARVMMTLPQQSDSGPILRADFDLRKVDTLTTLKVFQPGAMTIVQDGNNVALKMIVNPMDTADEWTMLPDGTVAILRAHDYHVDWVSPDGKITSSPKMAFDWKPMSDEQKQFKLDSIRPELEKTAAGMAGQTMQTPEGPRRVRVQFDFVPLSKLPDYEPAISPGALKVDPKGNLWIVPRTSAGANGGLLMDVVDRSGTVRERVQFPKGYALAGFGLLDEVYLLRVDGKVGFLERAKLR